MGSKLKDEELNQLRDSVQKKVSDSEEFRQVVDELEQRRQEVASKDSQMEEMYNKIAALEAAGNGCGMRVLGEEKKPKEGGEAEELRKRVEELEKVNDEMSAKFDQTKEE